MLFANWLRRMQKSLPPAGTIASRSRANRPRPGFVPRVEGLENRCVPSVFTVTNLNDSGTGSLRQAVASANAHAGGDVVQFAPGVHGSITLTSGQIDVTDDLAVAGPGANRVTVSG